MQILFQQDSNIIIKDWVLVYLLDNTESSNDDDRSGYNEDNTEVNALLHLKHRKAKHVLTTLP